MADGDMGFEFWQGGGGGGGLQAGPGYKFTPDPTYTSPSYTPVQQTGGGQGQQPFGYDPSQYVAQATNWANTMWGRGTDQYKWAQDQFAKNEGTANRVVDAAFRNSDMFDDAARAGVSRYESMYAPAMAQQLDFARNYASPENLALYRGQAMAGVGQAFDAQA